MATRIQRPRQPAPAPVLPADVRWLNLTANCLFALFAVLALTMALMWLVRQPLFTVESIRVEGDVSRNSEATLRESALPLLVGNFLTVDLTQTQRAFQSVPWVRHAVVRRVWPNRLAVRLEEHQAAALWVADGGGNQLVNTFGEVFEANPGDVDDVRLPQLQGPEGSTAQVLDVYHRLVPVFSRLDLVIERLSLSGRGSWRAEFEGGAEIELGRGQEDELVARCERFVSTVNSVIDRYQRPLVSADLRHNEGYALRLKGITTAPVAPAGGAKN